MIVSYVFFINVWFLFFVAHTGMQTVKRYIGNFLLTRLLFKTAWSNRPVAYNTPFITLVSDKGTFGSFKAVFVRRDRTLVLCTYYILRYNKRPRVYVPIIPLYGLLLRALLTYGYFFYFFFKLYSIHWSHSGTHSNPPLCHLTVTRCYILQIILQSV